MAASYMIVGIASDGRTKQLTLRNGAPPDSTMAGWGLEHELHIVGRFYPSRKRWEAIDIRRATRRNGYGKYGRIIDGIEKISLHWPTSDAMVMYILHKLARHSSTK